MSANIVGLLAERQLLSDELSSRRVFSSTHGHSSLVERLDYSTPLEGHRGCVNCLQWSSDGRYLLSGSDDMTAILWDSNRRKSVVTMATGHTGNIFSVKFVPFTNDSEILTGAEDRDVRLHDLRSLETKRVWSCSGGRVKRLAVHPQTPHLCWSAGEDGCIRQIDIREPHSCNGDGSCRNVIIDLNLTVAKGRQSGPQFKCIDVNPVQPEQLAIGALDAFVRIYDTRNIRPQSMANEMCSYGFPCCEAHFAPGHLSNPSIKKPKNSSNHASTYVSFSPNGRELLVNLSGEQVYLYDVRANCASLSYDIVDCVPTARPHRYVATCTRSKIGVASYRLTGSPLVESQISIEARVLKSKAVELIGAKLYTQAVNRLTQAIAVCPGWHSLYCLRATAFYFRKWDGDFYAALRDAESALAIAPTYKKAHQRRLKCILPLGMLQVAEGLLDHYLELFPNDKEFASEIEADLKKLQKGTRNGLTQTEVGMYSQWEISRHRTAFDYKSRFCGHCNTHTDIKEASFIGENGAFIAAGSDDGNLFIWRKSTGDLVRVLQGDDSIVNCVQWHPTGAVLASSGIESTVRLWEPHPHGTQHTKRLNTDHYRVCKENQKRMSHDPFEVMLLRMGFNIAAANLASHSDDTDQSNDSDEEEEGVRWVEDPSRCQQS